MKPIIEPGLPVEFLAIAARFFDDLTKARNLHGFGTDPAVAGIALPVGNDVYCRTDSRLSVKVVVWLLLQDKLHEELVAQPSCGGSWLVMASFDHDTRIIVPVVGRTVRSSLKRLSGGAS